jgi:diacylglycerol kinase (ATP)
MPIPDYLIIANPFSGSGRGRAVAEEVQQRLVDRGASSRLAFGARKGDGRKMTSEAMVEGVPRVIACGGDGTVHEVAGTLAGSRVVMGIVPCGKGNDLARVLNIPKDVETAADVLLKGEVRRIDMGRVGDRYYCTVAMVGFDAEVARSINEDGMPFGGTAAYVYGVLKTLLTYRSPQMRLFGDFGTVEGRIFLSAAGNTSTYGGGMRIAPSAVPDDGALDVCIVHHMPRWRVLLLFPRVYWGTHAKLPVVEIQRTRSLRIECPTPMWVFGDGEALCQTPTTIEVAPNALHVICPGPGR